MVPAGSRPPAARAAAEATLASYPAILLAQWHVLRPACAPSWPKPAACRRLRLRRQPADHRGREARPGGAVHPAGQAGAATAGGRTPHSARLNPATGDPGVSQAVRTRGGRSPCWSRTVRSRAGRNRVMTGRRAQNYWDGVVGALAAAADRLMHCSRTGNGAAPPGPELAEPPEMHGGPWTDPVTGYLAAAASRADPDHLQATLALIQNIGTADSPEGLASRDRSGGQTVPRQHRHPCCRRSMRRWRAVLTRKPWASRGGC